MKWNLQGKDVDMPEDGTPFIIPLRARIKDGNLEEWHGYGWISSHWAKGYWLPEDSFNGTSDEK